MEIKDYMLGFIKFIFCLAISFYVFRNCEQSLKARCNRLRASGIEQPSGCSKIPNKINEVRK